MLQSWQCSTREDESVLAKEPALLDSSAVFCGKDPQDLKEVSLDVQDLDETPKRQAVQAPRI